MAEVDTSIYKNQPDPLGTAKSVFSILNTAQQNQLLQTATQQRQLELQQSQANDLLTSVAPLANKPGLTQAELNATLADRARQLGLNGKAVYDIAAKRYQGPDWQNNLKLDAMRSLGPAGLLQRETVTDEKGRTSSIPGTSVISRPLATGIGPAAAAAESQTGARSGEALGGLGAEQSDYRRLVNPLEKAIPALERLGPTGAGPSSNETNNLKSLAITWGIDPKRFKGTVQDYDEAKKYLIDNARSMGNTSTNDQLAASFSANPNVEHMSQAASSDVAKSLLALRRRKLMQFLAFKDTGKSSDEFPGWSAKWETQHDPRAFGWDQYSPDQRRKILKSVKNPVQFKRDVIDAKNQGILTRPQDAQGNPSLE